MAYQPYNYNPYQNTYGQPLYPQQPYIQPQQTQPVGSLIEVRYAKYEEAMPFLVTEPNKKILFIITDKPMMVFKATDGMGISTTEQYKTQKIDNSTEETKTLDFDPKDYAKKEDLDKLIKSIDKQISDLTRRVKIKEILGEEVKDAKQPTN